MESLPFRLGRDRARNVQPWARRPMLNQIKCLMNGVVRANQKIRAGLGQLLGRSHHEFRDASPVAGVDALHVVSQRKGMQRHLGMLMLAELVRTFKRDCAIAEGGALGAASDNANVKHIFGVETLLSRRLSSP